MALRRTARHPRRQPRGRPPARGRPRAGPTTRTHGATVRPPRGLGAEAQDESPERGGAPSAVRLPALTIGRGGSGMLGFDPEVSESPAAIAPPPRLQLEALLRSERWPLRARAAYDLSRHGDRRSTEALTRLLLTDENEHVRGFSALALRWIGDPRAIPALEHALGDRSDRVRREAILALERTGDPGAARKVRGALGDPALRVRIAAAVVLGLRRDRTSVPALLARLRRSEVWERPALVTALGKIGSPRASLALARAAGDPQHSVRVCAIHALSAMRSPRARAVARSALADPSWAVRGAAALALGRVGGPGDAPRLVRGLADPHPWPRRGAIYALGALGATSALPSLRRALDDPDPEVRLAAIWALGKLRDLASTPRLCALLRGSRPTALPDHPLISTGDGGVRLVSDAESRMFDSTVQSVGALWRAGGPVEARTALRSAQGRLPTEELDRPARLPAPLGSGPPPPTVRALLLWALAAGRRGRVRRG